MCGEFMRLETREVVTRVPGTAQVVRTIIREWICKECEFFEEIEEQVPPP